MTTQVIVCQSPRPPRAATHLNPACKRTCSRVTIVKNGRRALARANCQARERGRERGGAKTGRSVQCGLFPAPPIIAIIRRSQIYHNVYTKPRNKVCTWLRENSSWPCHARLLLSETCKPFFLSPVVHCPMIFSFSSDMFIGIANPLNKI